MGNSRRIRLRFLVALGVCVVIPQIELAAGPVGVDLAQIDSWRIVVSGDAIPSEAYAAEEFQNWIEKATGHKLQIVKSAKLSCLRARRIIRNWSSLSRI